MQISSLRSPDPVAEVSPVAAHLSRVGRSVWIGFLFFFLLGSGVLFAIERGRLQCERGLSQLFETPVHVSRITLTPHRLTLHRVALGSHSFLTVERVQIQIEGSLFSLLGWSTDSWQQKIDSATVTRLALRLGGVPLQAQGLVFVRRADSHSGAQCEGWLNIDHPFLKGRVEIAGAVNRPVIFGWLQTFAGVQKRFSAQLSVEGGHLKLVQMNLEGGWSAEGSLWRARENSIHGLLHLFSPQGRFELNGEFAPEGKGHADLRFLSEDDRVPVTGSVAWEVRRPHLNLDLRFPEDKIHLAGSLELPSPHEADLQLNFERLGMEDIANLLGPEYRLSFFSGEMQGVIRIKGPLRRPVSDGEIISRNGEIGREPFQLAVVRFRGAGPLLEIQNSQITKPTGVLLMEGKVDLRRIGQSNFFSEVRLSSMEKSLALAGWKVSPLSQGGQGSSGFQMRRTSTDGQVEVGFAYKSDDQIDAEPIRREEVEVGYPLSNQEHVQMRLDREEGFLGVEHRKKF